MTLRSCVLHLSLDVNECDTGMDSCDSNVAVCVNTPGSYSCRCKAGFKREWCRLCRYEPAACDSRAFIVCTFCCKILTNVKLAWQTVMPMLFALTPQAVSPAHAAGDMKEMGQHALVRDHRNPFLYQDLMDRKLNDIPVAVSMGATKSNGGSVANSLVFHSGK